MEPQLIEAIREVMQSELKQELAPVHAKLGGIESKIEGIEGRLEGIEGRLEGIEGRLEGVEGRLEGVEGTLVSMQQQLDRIEETQNDDVVALLHQIINKVERYERTDSQLKVLNDRLFTVEADVRKLQQS